MLGLNAKLYRNSATYATPTWVEVKDISDLMVSPSWASTKFGTRASRIERGAKTLSGLTFSGKIKAHLTDVDYVAFRDAHLSPDSVVDFMILNGAQTANGVWGYRGEMLVSIQSIDQGLQAKIYDDFELFPADSDNDFSKAVVAAGSAVFTAL